MKLCKKCLKLLPLESFNKQSSNSLNFRHQCKACFKQQKAEYYLLNKEKIYRSVTNYYLSNRDKIVSISNANYHNNPQKDSLNLKKRIYYSKNKEKIKLKKNMWKINNKNYEKERLLDPVFKVKKYLRNRIKQAIKNNQKSGSAVSDLGCSINKLKFHLQLKFHRNPRGKHEYMTWDNYGEWHIDHKRPLSKFVLSNKEDFLRACHYTNLQPMWALDNIKKGNKI
jgi:hypothetical protein